MKDGARAVRDELIGLAAVVVASGHPPLVGTGGRVVDETARTLILETGDGRAVVVPKRGQRFRFGLPGGEAAEIDGAALEGHPAERIKINRRR